MVVLARGFTGEFIRRRYSLLTFLAFGFLLSGCQVTYLVNSAASQAEILMSRVPIDEAMRDNKLTDEQKRKLLLAVQAHDFAQNELGLKHNANYSTFVQLNRPYVSYVVSAAPKNELTHYLWWYPIVGKLPYKGFPRKDSAQELAEELKAKNYDTHMRGVSAYSTLGWFEDPILSSMLEYNDRELVNTIIHESVHATIYIKSEADFNERLAVFIGNIGTLKFYERREGVDSPAVRLIKRENDDEKMFSVFIGRELDAMTKWYDERKSTSIDEKVRLARLHEIQTRFVTELKPRLKTDSYAYFEKIELNNARLLNYQLYVQDLSDFETLFEQYGRDFDRLLTFCKTLQSEKNPAAALRAAIGKAGQ